MKPLYRRMIGVLEERSDAGPKEWGVYLLRCSDGSYYTGIAKDVKDRLRRHNAGKGAAYTRTRRPVRLLVRREGYTRSQALVLEAKIKSLPRPKKLKTLRSESSST